MMGPARLTHDPDRGAKRKKQPSDHDDDQPSSVWLHRRERTTTLLGVNGALVLWAVVGAQTCCASMDSNPNPFEPMSWADTDEVMDAIACAVETEHPDRAREIMDVQIFVRLDYALDGLYQPPRSIYLEAAFPSAQRSPLRHEFTHRILHITTGDTDPKHSPTFLAQYDRLNLNMAGCRARRGDRW